MNICCQEYTKAIRFGNWSDWFLKAWSLENVQKKRKIEFFQSLWNLTFIEIRIPLWKRWLLWLRTILKPVNFGGNRFLSEIRRYETNWRIFSWKSVYLQLKVGDRFFSSHFSCKFFEYSICDHLIDPTWKQTAWRQNTALSVLSARRNHFECASFEWMRFLDKSFSLLFFWSS